MRLLLSYPRRCCLRYGLQHVGRAPYLYAYYLPLLVQLDEHLLAGLHSVLCGAFPQQYVEDVGLWVVVHAPRHILTHLPFSPRLSAMRSGFLVSITVTTR